MSQTTATCSELPEQPGAPLPVVPGQRLLQRYQAALAAQALAAQAQLLGAQTPGALSGLLGRHELAYTAIWEQLRFAG